MAALVELEEARAVWLAYEAGFAERRRKEKHDGLRRPGSVDDWHRMTWGGFGVAWCDDPGVHPREPLADVLRKLIAALEREPGSACPVCGGERLFWKDDLDHEPSACRSARTADSRTAARADPRGAGVRPARTDAGVGVRK
ncbi:hypothetical protein SGLAM104S_03625 [Streptomyces glaucescens]